MTRAICVALVASVALAASAAALGGTAAAQPNVAGPPATYQRQPQPRTPPVAREPRVMNGNAVTDAIRTPRFQARALQFRVIDESGHTDIGSDEVFAVFREDGAHGVSPEHSVDTNDVIPFATRRNCVFSAYDADGARNGQWACRREGRQGPVLFRIMIYEIDPTLIYNECFRGGDTDLGVFACLDRPGDVLFDHTFNYDVPTAVSRTNNQCRCFVETARYRSNSENSEYEVQVRITRVDTAQPLAVDPNPPGSTGPVVHRSGALTAALNQRFELDGGAVGAAGDFAFERQGVIGASFRLAPNGGAKIWLGNTTARGHATCYAQRMSANYVTTPIMAPAAGTYACYVTSDGRVGELRFDAVANPLTMPTLTINYTTWQ